MARPPSGRLALAVFLVALAAVALAVGLAAALAAAGWGPRPASAGAAVDRAHAAHAAAQRERLGRLSLAARLLAGEGALASVLRGAGGEAVDGRAALADLLAQRQPGLGFDLAVVLDGEGRVVAASEGAAVAPGDDLAVEPPVAAALADGEAAGVWQVDRALLHVAVAPVAPDFELLGHVLVGAAVDRVFALEVARSSGAAVTFAASAGEGAVPVASSLGDAAAAELVAALGASGQPLAAALAGGETREAARVEVAGGDRRAMAVPLAAAGAGPAAGAVVLSADAGRGALGRFLPLAAGAAAGLLLALLLAPLVARSTLGPAARLAESVEAAPRESFARRLEPPRYRALAPLAAAIDRLFRRLHEERSLAAAAAAARRRLPGPAGEGGGAEVVAERAAVALFDLRRYATLGDDPQAAAAAHAADLTRLRQAVAAAGGRLEAVAGHRALARFWGDEAAWRAVTAASAGLAAVAAARSDDEGDAAAAAVASGRLAHGGGEGGGGGLLVGPAVQLAESVLRETAPGDLAMTRAVHREVADRLATRGATAAPQAGLLSPQPLHVLAPAAGAALVGAAPAPSAAAPVAGGRFAGRYQVLRREGSSAGAELWRVRDEEAGREAALKWLPRPPAGSAAAGPDGPLERVRRLDHPGLAGVDAVGEAGEGVFLVRDWVDGIPLSRLGNLPAPAALGLARQLAAALAAVHREGLAHGRVKPENVIVDGDGRVRLVDLGVAAAAGAAPSESAGERLLAPEQRAASASALAPGPAGDARADVYALGSLIHREVLGRWPGGAAAGPEDDPAGAAPAGLAALLARATAEDPARRHADAGELAAALEGVTA